MSPNSAAQVEPVKSTPESSTSAPSKPQGTSGMSSGMPKEAKEAKEAKEPKSNQSTAQVEAFKPVTDILHAIQKETNQLATEDFSTVVNNLVSLVEERVAKNPYETVAVAAFIGFGMGALNKHHFKAAAIRIGKLVAMKALSGIESKTLSEQSTD